MRVFVKELLDHIDWLPGNILSSIYLQIQIETLHHVPEPEKSKDTVYKIRNLRISKIYAPLLMKPPLSSHVM